MDVKQVAALVSGGASGLGEATVKRLVALGAKAAILDIDETRGRAVAEALQGRALFLKADVTDEKQVAAAVDEAAAAFGALTLAVSCAGIAPPAKILSKGQIMDLGHYNKVLQTNLVGTVNLLRFASAKMVANQPLNEDGERGLIVNTASVAAYEGQVGQVAYASSKAGVVGLTLPAARELARSGVRVMAIAPGLFNTPMMAGLPEKVRVDLAKTVPFPQRLGHPDEYARLVQAIIENSMLNGSVIRLDGAIRMSA